MLGSMRAINDFINEIVGNKFLVVAILKQGFAGSAECPSPFRDGA
jgi:hypothetical protein